MVKHAAIAGLLSVGCTPVDVGVTPLPTLMFHVRQTGAFGGILVGAAFGLLAVWFLKRYHISFSAVIMLSVILAYVAFIVAEHDLHKRRNDQ